MAILPTYKINADEEEFPITVTVPDGKAWVSPYDATGYNGEFPKYYKSKYILGGTTLSVGATFLFQEVDEADLEGLFDVMPYDN